MKSNIYLYGAEQPAKVPQSVIDDRCDLLRLNMVTELSRPLMKQDTVKVAAIYKAINFWEKINSVDLYEEDTNGEDT